MEKLDFVVWMLSYPIMLALCDYIIAKKRKINNEPPKTYGDDSEALSGCFFVILWFFVGYLLF